MDKKEKEQLVEEIISKIYNKKDEKQVEKENISNLYVKQHLLNTIKNQGLNWKAYSENKSYEENTKAIMKQQIINKIFDKNNKFNLEDPQISLTITRLINPNISIIELNQINYAVMAYIYNANRDEVAPNPIPSNNQKLPDTYVSNKQLENIAQLIEIEKKKIEKKKIEVEKPLEFVDKKEEIEEKNNIFSDQIEKRNKAMKLAQEKEGDSSNWKKYL